MLVNKTIFIFEISINFMKFQEVVKNDMESTETAGLGWAYLLTLFFFFPIFLLFIYLYKNKK